MIPAWAWPLIMLGVLAVIGGAYVALILWFGGRLLDDVPGKVGGVGRPRGRHER